MLRPGASRKRLARTLNAAYATGLLSEQTFIHRLDRLLESDLIEPSLLTGDLTLRTRQRSGAPISRAIESLRRLTASADTEPSEPAALLALDWTAPQNSC